MKRRRLKQTGLVALYDEHGMSLLSLNITDAPYELRLDQCAINGAVVVKYLPPTYEEDAERG